jgi:hypothetical protein
MQTYTRTLTIEIRAESPEDADGIAFNACEHLADTFNDDGSIGCWPETDYYRRVRAFEAEGMTTSDAQACADAEDAANGYRALQASR